MTKEELLSLGWVTPSDVHKLLPRISIVQLRKVCTRIRSEMIGEGKAIPYDNKLIVPAKRVIKEFEL